eukprot:COSAG01_NODE_2448_length_7682_cov_10.409600_6_plen_92_part_00
MSLALGVALPWLELRDIMTMHVGTVFSDTAVSFERVGQNIDNFKGKGQKIDKSGRVPQISENQMDVTFGVVVSQIFWSNVICSHYRVHHPA